MASGSASFGMGISPTRVGTETPRSAELSPRTMALELATIEMELETARVAQLQAQLQLQRARIDASDFSARGQAELARSQSPVRYPSPPATASIRPPVSSPRSPSSPHSCSPSARSHSPIAALELARLQVRAEELKLEQEKTKLECARLRSEETCTPQASRPLSPTAQNTSPVSHGLAAHRDLHKLVPDFPKFDGTGCPATWLHELMRTLTKHEVAEVRWAAVMRLKMTDLADRWLAATYPSGQEVSFETLSSDFICAFGHPWAAAGAHAQLRRLEGPWHNIVRRDQLNESRLALMGIPRDPCPDEQTWYRLQHAMETADPTRATALLQQLDAIPETSEHRLRGIEASDRAAQQNRRQSELPRANRSPARSAVFKARIEELERLTKTLPATIGTTTQGNRRIGGVAQAATVTITEDDPPGETASDLANPAASSPYPRLDPAQLAVMDSVRLATIAVMEGRETRIARSEGTGPYVNGKKADYPVYGKPEFQRRREQHLCFGCDRGHEKGKDPRTGDVWAYLSCRSHGPLATAEDRKAAAA